MAFKMRGFPMHNTSALKQKSAFKQDDPAAMEAMMGMMGGAAPEGAPVEEETVPTEDNEVTIQEFQNWIVETEPEGWEGSDGTPETEEQEASMKKAIAKINSENPEMAEAEKMPLILKALEGGAEAE